jgi:hypothetical protein
MTGAREPPPEDLDIIETGRRYFLVAGDGFFGVWDSRGGEDAIERFPPTYEGFDAAERRFRRLRRLQRKQGSPVVRSLWVLVLVGTGLWMLSGLLAAVFIFGPLARVGDGFIAEATFLLDAVGFRLGVGALFLLAGWIIVGRLGAGRPAAETEAVREAPAPTTSDRWDGVLSWALGFGLATWVGMAVFTHLVFPFEFTVFGTPRPRLPSAVAQLVETMAFRVWVAAAVLLLFRWGWAGIRQAPRGRDPRLVQSEADSESP